MRKTTKKPKATVTKGRERPQFDWFMWFVPGTNKIEIHSPKDGARLAGRMLDHVDEMRWFRYSLEVAKGKVKDRDTYVDAFKEEMGMRHLLGCLLDAMAVGQVATFTVDITRDGRAITPRSPVQ